MELPVFNFKNLYNKTSFLEKSLGPVKRQQHKQLNNFLIKINSLNLKMVVFTVFKKMAAKKNREFSRKSRK